MGPAGSASNGPLAADKAARCLKAGWLIDASDGCPVARSWAVQPCGGSAGRGLWGPKRYTLC